MRVLKPLISIVILAVLAMAGFKFLGLAPKATPGKVTAAEAAPVNHELFRPTEKQWSNLILKPVAEQVFRSELSTDGKIAIDEDRTTPVFSPYSGVVKRLAAKTGDGIEAGQLLFTIEATDMVQAQNDFITALDAVRTADSQLELARKTEQRQHALFDAKATPQKDWQQAQSDLIVAENTKRTAEIGLDAVRNRLRILKKTDAEIAEFEKTGKINPETPIYAPIAGTIVQRKVGPGQFITSGASDPTGDPVYVIGNLANVWLVANVREADALAIAQGQSISFRVLSAHDRVFSGTISYVAEVMDPNTRRLLVRASVPNPDKVLKPEMFARVTIYTSEPQRSPALPREAVIYEGNEARVWVLGPEKSLALRKVTLGAINGDMVQVLSGVSASDQILTRGTLFIDRAASTRDDG